MNHYILLTLFIQFLQKKKQLHKCHYWGSETIMLTLDRKCILLHFLKEIAPRWQMLYLSQMSESCPFFNTVQQRKCYDLPHSSPPQMQVCCFFSPQKGRFPLESVHVQNSRGGGGQGKVAPLRPRPHNHPYMSVETTNVCLWGSNRDVTWPHETTV